MKHQKCDGRERYETYERGSNRYMERQYIIKIYIYLKNHKSRKDKGAASPGKAKIKKKTMDNLTRWHTKSHQFS